MRYFIEIAYNGAAYHGWQKQNNALSVQSVLEKALSTLLRQPVETTASGRTDAGVHCRRQFVHFDADMAMPSGIFLRKINGILPNDLAVGGLWPMPPAAHARFDALWRRYEYHIGFKKDPFDQGFCLRLAELPDVEAMNEAAVALLRHTDFQSFSKVHTDAKTFLCDVHEAKWAYKGEKLIFHVTANRFLRGMVRALVGTLLEVGKGRMDAGGFEQVILQKDRKAAAAAAPPDGLFLMDVGYPQGYFEQSFAP